MLFQKLYLQICAIFVASLLVFSLFAAAAWAFLGEDDFNQDLFVATASLSEMLIPGEAEGISAVQDALRQLHQNLDLDLSVYGEDRSLVARAGDVGTELGLKSDIAVGAWQQASGGTQWTTKMPDGRYVVINTDRIELPGESQVFVAFLGVIAVAIAIIMYPFIRHVTGRLERLQLAVTQIGFGRLNARVVVEGNDEIAKLAMNFNDAATRIEALVQSQQLLLANASHELRTPLARIRVGLDLLDSSDTSKGKNEIRKDINELNEIIDELILMARLDTGLGEEQREPFDLLGLVAEECSRYPECEFGGEAIEVLGDRRLVQHLIRNLVDNALTHGEAPVNVTVEQNEGSATLKVSDGGNGISPDDAKGLLEPFRRGKGLQNIPGSGLGLTLVKKIADAHKASFSMGGQKPFAIIISFCRSA